MMPARRALQPARVTRSAASKRASALALCLAATVMPACITERVGPAPIGAASRSTIGTTRSPSTNLGPVAAPATDSRSQQSSARVVVQPIGLVPYGGLILPQISPDGRYLATQVGPAPTFEALLGDPAASTPGGAAVELYDISQSPIVRVVPAQPAPGGLVLAGPPRNDGFVVRAAPPGQPARSGVLGFDGVVRWSADLDDTNNPAHSADDHMPDALAAHLLRRPSAEFEQQMRWSFAPAPSEVARAGLDYALVLGPSYGGMVLADPTSLRVIPLASGSVAGCWAPGPAPAVLLSTREGLMMQSLERDASGWRAAEPRRLLRDPWVPVATTDPARPFILIGPGPRSQPEMLQIVAMRFPDDAAQPSTSTPPAPPTAR